MAIAGTYPEQGVRVALDLHAADATTAQYNGEVFTPVARYTLTLAIDVATGKGSVVMKESVARDGGTPPPLDPPDVAFVKQLGTQLWRQATLTAPEKGGGAWARRVQRWRGPK